MKKRSVLVTVLAMVLASVISVGGTLAYLTAEDDEVVNTFKFANDMTVTLKEEVPTNPPKNVKVEGNNQNGVDYENIVPGQELPKEPKVWTNTSVDAFVFVKISGASDKVWPTAIEKGWNPVVIEGQKNPDTHNNGVWYKAVSAAVDANGKSTEQELGAIFKTVTVGAADVTNATTDVNLGSITIDVYEIQQAGFADANAAYKEVPKPFGPKEVSTTA